MALRYVDVKRERGFRILFFFAVVILFYFAMAFALALAVSLFLVYFNRNLDPLGLVCHKAGLISILSAIVAILHVDFSLKNAVGLICRALRAGPADPTDSYHRRFRNIVEEVRKHEQRGQVSGCPIACWAAFTGFSQPET